MVKHCLKGRYSNLCMVDAYIGDDDGNHWLLGTVTVQKNHHLRRNRKTVPAYYCVEQKKWYTDPKEKFTLCQKDMQDQAQAYLKRKGLHNMRELWNYLMGET